jgi:hypothetical protein
MISHIAHNQRLISAPCSESKSRHPPLLIIKVLAATLPHSQSLSSPTFLSLRSPSCSLSNYKQLPLIIIKIRAPPLLIPKVRSAPLLILKV